MEKLSEMGVRSGRHIRIATEGALIGSILEHGFNVNLAILGDDAGQFNVFLRALCRIHAERTINRLAGFNEPCRQALESGKTQIRDFHAGLKKYREAPDSEKAPVSSETLDQVFTENTCFSSLNQALLRIHKNRDELPPVLKRPDIPLHNNTSERDIREYVKNVKSADQPAARQDVAPATPLPNSGRHAENRVSLSGNILATASN